MRLSSKKVVNNINFRTEEEFCSILKYSLRPVEIDGHYLLYFLNEKNLEICCLSQKLLECMKHEFNCYIFCTISDIYILPIQNTCILFVLHHTPHCLNCPHCRFFANTYSLKIYGVCTSFKLD